MGRWRVRIGVGCAHVNSPKSLITDVCIAKKISDQLPPPLHTHQPPSPHHRPTTPQGNQEVLERTADMLSDAFAFADKVQVHH